MNRFLLAVALCVFGWQHAPAQEVIPSTPTSFFSDFAGVVPATVAATLNERLAQFERDSSNQLLVVVYSKMESPSSLEDATRIFEAWGVGRKGQNNGAVLFVFVQDRKMRIQTGYGLEGALTDAESFQIIEGIKPFFRAGDYPGGLTFAVDAMIAATEGEFVGTGRTHAEENEGAGLTFLVMVWLIGIFVFVFRRLRGTRRGYVYDGTGRHVLTGGGGWSSGGGSSWSSGGGSSFSGGGGSSGGGGASGSW